jgi:hypothetical protein
MRTIFSIFLLTVSPLALSETSYGHIRKESDKWMLRPFGKNATSPAHVCDSAEVQKYQGFYVEAVLKKDTGRPCLEVVSISPAVFDPLKESLNSHRPKPPRK